MNIKKYDQDGLNTIHNHEFMDDPEFIKAYQRGVQAVGMDYSWHWRVHIGLWAAKTASVLEGDFVECGVNKGFMSSAIMHNLNWNELQKTFYLLDTFEGIDERYVTVDEMEEGIMDKNEKLLKEDWYTRNFEAVSDNFKEWKNVKIIKGPVPHTLSEVDAEKVSFLHVDMNCAPPEAEAVRYFWDKLAKGGIILFDDYAYYGYRNQKLALDEVAESYNFNIVALPTGQGLVVKT